MSKMIKKMLLAGLLLTVVIAPVQEVRAETLSKIDKIETICVGGIMFSMIAFWANVAISAINIWREPAIASQKNLTGAAGLRAFGIFLVGGTFFTLANLYDAGKNAPKISNPYAHGL